MESIISVLTRTLASLTTRESTLLRNREGKMFSLQKELEMIQAVLSDVEETEHKVELVQTWLQRLREVAYDAIDVFDEVNMECALHPEVVSEAEVGVTGHFIILVSACFLSCFPDMPSPIVFQNRMGKRIDDIIARFDDIKKMREGLMDILCRPNELVSFYTRETSSLPDKDQPLLGRDEQKQKLVEMLCASDDGSVPTLVSIVGMGGVGKTTIAQAVYNDDKIKEHFSLRKWVFVGEKFDVRRIIEELLPGASKQEIFSGNPTLKDLLMCLISEIRGQKFFIVLDDVWNENPGEWDPLWWPLKYGAKGSKVLITTRSEVVAMVKGPRASIIKLEGLSNDDCWSIFEKIAFVGGRREEDPEKQKEIGMEIVKKLGGIPLAAKLIGGALKRHFLDPYFIGTDLGRLMVSDIWSKKLNEVVIPGLLLSYQALPSHLKLCFQFCSLFPKGYEFDRKTLVWMWMAHDFIEPPIGGERVEDVGSRYFDGLVQRSFFQYINDSYVMHAFIHDLAQFVSDGQCSRVEDKRQLGSKQFHHLSLFCEDELEAEDLDQFNRTRTLLDLPGNPAVASDPILCQLLGQLRCIRVLSLCGCDGIRSLPECISNLKHLRYLDLRGTLIKKLPESLCTLYNLQTLMLPTQHDLLLPKGMSKLVNLRNLEADEEYFLNIEGIGKLTCLQELKGTFKVSKKKNEGRNIGELKGMNQLRGTLRIEILKNVSNVEEDEGFPLKDMVLLERLELKWESGSENEYSDNTASMIVALHPPQQLKKLKLENHPGSEPPSWMSQDHSLLPNLEVLELVRCVKYTCVPSSLSLLPSLKSLVLEGMSKIGQVGPKIQRLANAVTFSSLEHLQFKDMPELERWVVDSSWGEANRELWRDAFPQLRNLCFQTCPKLSTIICLLRRHNLSALEQVIVLDCKELVKLLLNGEEEGKGKQGEEQELGHISSLRQLRIQECSALSSLAVPLMLQELFILRCPLLAKVTWGEMQPDLIGHSNSLPSSSSSSSSSTKTVTQQLELVETDNRLLLSCLLLQPRRLEFLQKLTIKSCEELMILSLPVLPSLVNLQIVDCALLEVVELLECDVTVASQPVTSMEEEKEGPRRRRNLPSLKYLSVHKCPNLCSLPEGLNIEPTISDCPKLHAPPSH